MYAHGLLPHWRQDGCTYFVTFRLADSLPKEVVEGWKRHREAWLRGHGIDPKSQVWVQELRKLSPALQREFETEFGERLDRFLDAGHGSCVLRVPKLGGQVARSLSYFDGERVLAGDYVVMPNHVHAIMRPIGEHELEDVLQSIKSYTAHEINRMLGSEGQVWQKESYDHIIRDHDELRAYQRYIRENPVKARLSPGGYVLSEEKRYQEEL